MNLFTQNLQKYLTARQLVIIQSQKIGIGGAGGIGANAALILARIGFCHFEILDSDTVEFSNLNRQPFFSKDVGKQKVRALKEHLTAINPDLKIQTHTDRWSRENAATFFPDCAFILEAFDEAENKHAFVEFYQDKTPYVISASGMAGLDKKSHLKIQRVGNIFIVGDQKTDSAAGHPPLAPRVVACAAWMAEIVLDLTLDIKREFFL